MVSVAVEARRRHEHSKPLQELEGGEDEGGAAVDGGAREAVDEPSIGGGKRLGAVRMQALEGERRAGEVACEALESREIGAFHPDGAVYTEGDLLDQGRSPSSWDSIKEGRPEGAIPRAACNAGRFPRYRRPRLGRGAGVAESQAEGLGARPPLHRMHVRISWCLQLIANAQSMATAAPTTANARLSPPQPRTVGVVPTFTGRLGQPE